MRTILLDYLIVLICALAMLGLGWYGTRKAKSQNGFLVAERRLGPDFYLETMVAMVLGGVSTIGTVELGYQLSLSGLWLVFMLGLGIIILSLVFSRQIARLRASTVIQVLEQRYQASSRLIGEVVMVAYDLMVTVTTIIAISSIIEVVFGIPRIPVILCGGGIVIVYSMIGGMQSLTLTDIIQSVVETVGILLVLLPLSIDGVGDLTRMQEVLPVGFFDLGHVGLDTVLTYSLLYFFGTLIGQGIWQRMFTVYSEMMVHYAGPSVGVYCAPYGTTCVSIGATARVLLSGLTMPENVYAEITHEVLAPGLHSLMVAAALSVTMSTVSRCLLAAATMLQEGTYARFLCLGATSDIRLNRCIALLMGIAMLVLACLINDIIAALNIAYNLLVGGLLVPVVDTLLRRRANPQGAITSIVTGCLAVVVCMAHDGLLTNSPIIYGLLANLATFVAVSPATCPVASSRAQPE